MKGKFRIEKIGDIQILFQVLEMDERFRRGEGGSDCQSFYCKNGLFVTSAGAPELKKPTIYLRGSDKKADYCAHLLSYSSLSERDEFFNKIIAALNDWANNWPGWGEEKGDEQVVDSRWICKF